MCIALLPRENSCDYSHFLHKEIFAKAKRILQGLKPVFSVSVALQCICNLVIFRGTSVLVVPFVSVFIFARGLLLSSFGVLLHLAGHFLSINSVLFFGSGNLQTPPARYAYRKLCVFWERTHVPTQHIFYTLTDFSGVQSTGAFSFFVRPTILLGSTMSGGVVGEQRKHIFLESVIGGNVHFWHICKLFDPINIKYIKCQYLINARLNFYAWGRGWST